MNTYEKINSKYSVLHITGNKIDGDIIIDTKNINKLKKYSWYIKQGSPLQYVAAKIGNSTIKMHRFLTRIKDRKIIVDHLDGDTFNNRENNFRITNSSMNNLNCSFSKNNTSGRTGVTFHKGQGTRSDSFVAKCIINKKTVTKNFSIKKYGKKKAFKLACDFRLNFEKENKVLTAKTFNDYRNSTSRRSEV